MGGAPAFPSGAPVPGTDGTRCRSWSPAVGQLPGSWRGAGFWRLPAPPALGCASGRPTVARQTSVAEPP